MFIKHTPIKKKFIKVNQKYFMDNGLSQAVMISSKH